MVAFDSNFHSSLTSPEAPRLRERISIAEVRRQTLSTSEADFLKGLVNETLGTLKRNQKMLERAALFSVQHAQDTAIEGVEQFDDDKLLTVSGELALVSEVNGRWADDFQNAIRLLCDLRQRVSSWSQDAEDLVSELRHRYEQLRVCERICLECSLSTGREYDRRHPPSDVLPFEPIDLGATNSARLPPVL